MRYYLDCEFFGWGGPIISLALVGEDDSELYLAFNQTELEHEARIVTLADERKWVLDNVLPIIDVDGAAALRVGRCRSDVAREWPHHIASFLRANQHPVTIVADWPEDIRHICEFLMAGPGQTLIPSPRPMLFEWVRVDAYPTKLRGAVQHNAMWDARALRHHLTGR